MKKILLVILLSYTITGCIITQYHGLHNIITENVIKYEKSDNVDFDNIASILKTYANLINSKHYSSLDEVKRDTNKFTKRLENNDISKNYPIRASKEEIIIIKSFLNDVLKNIYKINIKPQTIKIYINQALKVYLIEILNNENKIYN